MLKTILSIGMLLALYVSAGEPVILLTGFEPFGGAKMNASWEAVRGFQGKTIAGHRVETIQLPVVYDAIEAPLKDAIAKFKPDAVICFGEGTKTVQIETVALNGYHPMKPRDNKGLPPPRSQIALLAAPKIPTGLPFEAILKALQEAGIPARSSTDAGGYLCNECFYRVMSLPDAPAKRGFIHVPPVRLPDGAAELEQIQRAVKIAVETALR